MGLRKKKSLIDQAREQASEYAEAVKPHVEAAIDSATDFVQHTALPALHDAREKAGPALADAREKAAPVVADARDRSAGLVADARDKAAPVIASGAALAAERATAVRELADAKVAELKGEPVKKKRSKLKTLLVLAGVAGAVAVVAKKLQDSQADDNWQTSYTPSPAPAAPATPATSAAAAEAADDSAGAMPGEALSDAAEAPHPVTDPDHPAESVEVEDPDRS